MTERDCPRRPMCPPVAEPMADSALLDEATRRIRTHADRIGGAAGIWLRDTADDFAAIDPADDGVTVEMLAALMGRTRAVDR